MAMHELRLTCIDPEGDRVMSIRRYSDDDPSNRTAALEKLSQTARRWRSVGYPVTIIEDDKEVPLGLW